MIALLIDIGNSRIKWRIVSDEVAFAEPQWITSERALALADLASIDDAFAEQAGVAVATVLCSNVASDHVAALVRAAVSRVWRDAPLCFLRSLARQCGVVNGYRDPTQLGPDRWMAMIGAHARFSKKTLLVCSFGTATTIDLLVGHDDPRSPDDVRFVGGLILPGFDAMRTELSNSTARLPMAAGRVVDFADDTDDAITSGIVAAQLGAVERAWRKAGTVAATRAPLLCVLAGGGVATAAPLLADMDVNFEVVHDLVLRGMASVAAGARILTVVCK